MKPLPGTNGMSTRKVSLRRRLATVLMGISLISVLLLGALNYFAARSLLTDAVGEALTGQGSAQAREIRSGLSRVQATVSVVARDEQLADGLAAFTAAFQDLESRPETMDQTEVEQLRAFYQTNLVDRVDAAGFSPPALEEVIPASSAGTYLQYHYIVENPHGPEDRSELVEAAVDNSAYGVAHAERHPGLERLRATFGFQDLLLVDTAGNVVYSARKSLDFGTNLIVGPYRATALASLVTKRLATAPVGDTVYADFEFYLPAGARPTMFAAAAVRSDSQTIGAIVVEISIDALNRLTTANGRWEDAGLGKTGEVYIVGADHLMRSEPRLWIEDQAQYLSDIGSDDLPPSLPQTGSILGDLTASLPETMSILGTTVLLQPVQTEAVDSALDGVTFIGRTVNYLGTRTLTFAAPVGADGLEWVVVAEVSGAEAGASLRSFGNRLLVTAAILLPMVGLLALALADRMVRPADPVVTAAAAIAAGDLNSEVPDLGRNEFGDVARRLNVVTADLRAQDKALADEEQEISRLLLSALPPRLVEKLRSGEKRVDDLVDTATVIALTVEGIFGQAGVDADSGVELSSRLSRSLEEAAERLGVERVRSSSSQHLFVAGLDLPQTEADRAVEFVLEARRLLGRFGEETGLGVTYHAGLGAGKVMAGLLSGDQLTYGVFGEPVQIALTLDAIAADGQILLDQSVVGDLGTRWRLEPLTDLIDLRGEPIEAMVLMGEGADELQAG